MMLGEASRIFPLPQPGAPDKRKLVWDMETEAAPIGEAADMASPILVDGVLFISYHNK